VYVKTTKQLCELIDQARADGRIGIDLEFIRERTYFPQLALVQLAVGESHVLIDPLGPVKLDALDALIGDPSVVKVFHAAKQDLEIFFLRTRTPPRNIFDTQIAAALVGLGGQVAYGGLVRQLLGVRLEKGESYSDWLRRPLTASQERYALDDVVYLLPALDRLTAQLESLGRASWMQAECAHYEDPQTFVPEPSTLYRRVKRYRALNPRAMAALRELAIWREAEAVRRDRPRRSVVRDEVLIEIARKGPRSVGALTHTRGLHPEELRTSGADMVASVARGLAVPDDQCPQTPTQTRAPVNADAGLAADLVMACLRTVCQREQIAPEMITNRAGVEQLVVEHRSGATADHPVLQGWRGDLVGRDLLAILEGRAGIYLDPESGRPQFEARVDR
jgi:ribonuclease D